MDSVASAILPLIGFKSSHISNLKFGTTCILEFLFNEKTLSNVEQNHTSSLKNSMRKKFFGLSMMKRRLLKNKLFIGDIVTDVYSFSLLFTDRKASTPAMILSSSAKTLPVPSSSCKHFVVVPTCHRGMLELVATLPGHKADRVWHVAWSVDGRYLASCGEDREIRIWESVVEVGNDCVFTGVGVGIKRGSDDDNGWSNESCIRCIAALEDGQLRTIRCCEWSPNGKMIASASFDGTVVVWEAQNNSKSRWDQVSSLEGHENEVKSVAWSSDSRWLATCGRDKRVWIWERLQDNEFECVSMLDGHSQDVKFVIWHPFYSVLYSASYDDSIKVWGIDETDSSDDWRCVNTLTGHTSTVWNLAINESGNQLISCSDDCSIILWKYDGSKDGFGSWRQAAVLNNLHKLTIYSISWSNHTGIIATGSGDNAISLNQLGDASIDGDGIILTIARCEQAHSNDINCVRWNPGFHYQNILASSGDDGLIKIWIVK